VNAEPAQQGLRGLVAAVVVALALLLGGGPDAGGAPAGGAARLVPADALVYVHLSTDTSRPATRSAAALAERFPGWPALRDGLVKRFDAPGCRLGSAALRQSDEATLALLPANAGAAAMSLVLVDTPEDHGRGARRACGALSAQYLGRYLAIGQPAALDAAQALAAGEGRSLAGDARYREASASLPAVRVADGWATVDGVERLLLPQGGVLGAVAALLDQPALRGAGFGLSASGDVVHVRITSLLSSGRAAPKPFEPTLAAVVPADALAYFGVSDLEGALRRATAAAGSTASLAPLVAGLGPDVLALFRGEVAVMLTPDVPAPVLTVVASTKDPAAARRAIAKLPRQLRDGLFPTVWGDKVIASTSRAGVDRITRGGDRLVTTSAYRTTVGSRQGPVTSVVFLDFNRLLSLGEQTGLGKSTDFQRYKPDLDKVSALGARSSSKGSTSTAEISVLTTP
jgi:hypothetical protein